MISLKTTGEQATINSTVGRGGARRPRPGGGAGNRNVVPGPCEAGDMQAIKELADRLDGRPAQILEHSGPDSEPITKIVNEIVHVHETREEILAAEEPVLIEWSGVRDANGKRRTQ